VVLLAACGHRNGIEPATNTQTWSAPQEMVVRIEDQPYLFGLSIDPSGVYVTAGGDSNPHPTSAPGSDTFGVVRRVAPAGGAVTELWSGQGVAYRLAVDGDDLYFMTSDYWSTGRTATLYRMSKAGGAPTPLQSWSAQGICLGLSATLDGVYATATTGGSGVLYRVSGGAAATELSSSVYCDGLIAALDGDVYVLSGAHLYVVPKAGGATDLLWDSGQDELVAIVASATMHALFVVAGDQIVKVDPRARTTAPWIGGQSGVRALATDEVSLYTSNLVSGQISRISLATGSVSVVAANQGAPGAIALDPTHVYWVDGKSRTVIRAPK
jgi:hypothetical protein